jgi:GT2 family glycosyltransferase
MNKQIYILLPVHNRCAVTLRFIACLKSQTVNWRLILIDDGCTDGTAEKVASILPETTILKGNGNLWWAGSLDIGYKWLQGSKIQNHDIVLIINDDVFIQTDFLATGSQLLSDMPNTLLLARCRNTETGEILETGIKVNFEKLEFNVAKSSEKINCLSTRGLFLTWEDMSKIGGFHPWLLPHYFSDYEYTIRAVKQGLNCATHPKLFLESFGEYTGYRTARDFQEKGGLKRYLSKRSAVNPLYRVFFVFLASPLRYVPRHLRLIYLDTKKMLKLILTTEHKSRA